MSVSDPVRPITDWVLSQALQEFSTDELLAGMARRLIEAGYAVERIHIANRILHPLYRGTGHTWQRQGGVERSAFVRGDDQAEQWLRSPLRHMMVNRLERLRIRICEGEGVEQFPICEEFARQGVTDYLSAMTGFGDSETAFEREDGILVSWTTCKAGGWNGQEVEDILHLQSRLAVAIRIHMRETLARDVISAYLGADAGKRVLEGQIARGDGEDIDAVIWFADLRASTRLAEELGRDSFLELLNEFFECAASPVQDADGEILNYIGDAVLGIFPFSKFDDRSHACSTALEAAKRASTLVAGNNKVRRKEGKEAIGFGIGLHPGRVMFGNIGIPDRLAFSVTGSAVNIAARVTDQCRPLGEEIIVSRDFRSLAGGEWRDLGEFELRNVNRPMALYAPR